MKPLCGPNIKWRTGNLDSRGLLRPLLDQHRQWISSVARDWKEIPLGYTEWTLAGQLAMAAHKKGYYALQEYFIERKPSKEKKLKRFRPDLYVSRGLNKADYVFEIKQTGLDLVDDGEAIVKECKGRLKDGKAKLKYYRKEAKHRVCLLTTPLWVELDRWEADFTDETLYARGLSRFSQEYSNAFKKLPKGCSNFYWGFAFDHGQAKKEYERARYDQRSPFPVGVGYIGCFRPDGTRGR